MAIFDLSVPGYAATLSRGGPDIFDNVSNLAWTDQLGLRSGTDVRFNGKPNLVHDFHFPFTIPFAFGPGTTSQLSTIEAAFVTFRMTNPAVRVDRIRVFD